MCGVLYADVHELKCNLLTTNETVRDVVYDFIVNKSSNCTLISEQAITKNDYYIGIATMTPVYNVYCTIRIVKSKGSIKDEIQNKFIWFKNNYSASILMGSYIEYHNCTNDNKIGEGEPCASQILWQK
jgi:hypothetical protein